MDKGSPRGIDGVHEKATRDHYEYDLDDGDELDVNRISLSSHS